MGERTRYRGTIPSLDLFYLTELFQLHMSCTVTYMLREDDCARWTGEYESRGLFKNDLIMILCHLEEFLKLEVH